MTALAPSLRPCRHHPCPREYADLAASFQAFLIASRRAVVESLSAEGRAAWLADEGRADG